MAEDIIIETRHVDPHERSLYFTLPNGKKCHIGPYDLDFFRQLQALPAVTKIKMMRLTEEEMLAFIEEAKTEARNFLKELITKKWYWRTDGEELQSDDFKHLLSENGMTQSDILKKLKSKAGLPLKTIKEIIQTLTGDNSEIYTKDEE